MRHRKSGRRLNRKSSHREAMMTNLLLSLVKHERIVTTLGRAKELRIIAEKVITLAKKKTPAAHIQLSKFIKAEREENIKKLVNELAPRFADRNGGYTRIIKYGFRKGDGAPTAIIEYIGAEVKKAHNVVEEAEAVVETSAEEKSE